MSCAMTAASNTLAEMLTAELDDIWL